MAANPSCAAASAAGAGKRAMEHTVLSHFDCPEERDEWVPLVVGTRWEYVPAEPAEDFDALVVVRLMHLDDDGRYYLARTEVGNRRDE